MTPLPLPGGKEAELMAKVGTGVLQGLRKASQPPPWPNTHDALLELHAILYEWCDTAEETSRYARHRALTRKDPTVGHDGVIGLTQMATSNIGSGYVEGAVLDSKAILDGRVPALLKLRGSSKRRAARRGLRAILSVYCPTLLDQFEQATAARFEWVREHRKNFDRWFDQSRTDAEVSQLLDGMEATKTALLEATAQLRDFITTNYPLPRANPTP